MNIFPCVFTITHFSAFYVSALIFFEGEDEEKVETAQRLGVGEVQSIAGQILTFLSLLCFPCRWTLSRGLSNTLHH